MPIEYRFLLKLNAVDDGRHIELMTFLQSMERGSGKNKWRKVLSQTQHGETPVVYRTNSQTEARRMHRAIHQHGGSAVLEDLSPS